MTIYFFRRPSPWQTWHRKAQISTSALGTSWNAWWENSWSGTLTDKMRGFTQELMEQRPGWMRISQTRGTSVFPLLIGKERGLNLKHNCSIKNFQSRTLKKAFCFTDGHSAYSWVYYQENENDQTQSSPDLFMSAETFSNTYYEGEPIFDEICQRPNTGYGPWYGLIMDWDEYLTRYRKGLRMRDLLAC